MNLRTGIDLIEISRLGNLQAEIRTRFLKRVYTAKELAEAGNSNATLAGRFAAKEAVAKALGTGIGPVSWQDIEIVQGGSKEPVLILHGPAQRLAKEQQLVTWSISISHNQTYAVAVAVAIGESPAAMGEQQDTIGL
jgi:holo-[acyl-carrier protein] synthase